MYTKKCTESGTSLQSRFEHFVFVLRSKSLTVPSSPQLKNVFGSPGVVMTWLQTNKMDNLLAQYICYAKSTLSDKNITPKIYFWDWRWAGGKIYFLLYDSRELKIFEHKNSILNNENNNNNNNKITKKLLPNHFTHNDITTLLAGVSFWQVF